MSDLFDKFVFDLQRFDDTVIPYDSIGSGSSFQYHWPKNEDNPEDGFPLLAFVDDSASDATLSVNVGESGIITALNDVTLDADKSGYNITYAGRSLANFEAGEATGAVNIYYNTKKGSISIADMTYNFESGENELAHFVVNGEQGATSFDFNKVGAGLQVDENSTAVDWTYNGGTSLGDSPITKVSQAETWIRRTEETEFEVSGLAFSTDDGEGDIVLLDNGKSIQVSGGTGSAAATFDVNEQTFTDASVDDDTAIEVAGMSGEDLAINGESVNVNVDYVFTRIGGDSKIDLSEATAPADGFVVSKTGNATQVGLSALSGANVTIVEDAFTANVGASFFFEVDSEGATGVSGITTAADSVTGAFFKRDGFTFNGESVGLTTQKPDNTYTYSLNTLSGLVDGDEITEAGSISKFITKEISDGATFGVPSSAMSFAGNDADGVEFNFNGGSFAGVSGLNKELSVEGDFTTGDITVNGKTLDTNDDSLTLYGMGESNADAIGIGKIAGFTGGSDSATSITDAGGASSILTDGAGLFKVGEQSFGTEGDSSIEFVMQGGDSTVVKGISGFGGEPGTDATLTGALSTVWINAEGNSIAVTGDKDDDFSYIYRGETEKYVLGGVSGDNVTINGTGGAEIVQVTGSGSYTFNLDGGSGVKFEVALGGDSDGVEFLFDKSGKLIGISSFDKGDTITGDFSGSAIAIYGKNEGEVESTSVQVDGDTYVVVNHDAFQLEKISDGAYIVQADGISYAYTDELGADSSITITDASGDVFTITAGAAGGDSVMLILDGHAEIIGVSALGAGVSLEGALNALSSINGETFAITGDSSFGVVGSEGASGIGVIYNLGGDSVTINYAGGASQIFTDEDGTFFFADNAASGITISDDDEVIFGLSKGSNAYVTSIDGLSGEALAHNSVFAAGLSINSKSVDIVNDADDMIVKGNSAEDGIDYIADVGPSSLTDVVTINDAGGASFLMTDKEGGFSFASGDQLFRVYGDSAVTFGLSSEKVTSIDSFAQNGESVAVVLGPLNGVAINGNSAIEVTVDGESTPNLGYAVYGDKFYLGTYGTSAGASVAINNAGDADYFFTSNEGTFDFAGNSTPFTVAGDSSVVFDLVKGDPATAAGVSYLGMGEAAGGADHFGADVAATITGELQGFAINGSNSAIDVTGDADDIFSFAVDDKGIGSGSHATLGNVAPEDISGTVAINGTGGASVVEITGEGGYDFFGAQEFVYSSASGTFSGDSVAQFLLDGQAVGAINSFDTGDTVMGGFSSAIDFNAGASGVTGKVQVIGGDEIEVTNDGDALIIRDLDDGSTFGQSAVIGVKEAWTEELTTGQSSIAITDAVGNSFTVSGEDATGVQFLVDKTTGAINGVSSLDEGVTLAGALDALSSINGRMFDIQGDSSFVVVGSESAQGIGAIYGLGSESGVTINNAGGASQIYTDEEGSFYFRQGSASSEALYGVTLETDSAWEDDEPNKSAVFELDPEQDSYATGVRGLSYASNYAQAAHEFFEDYGFTVNGKSVGITGDEGDLVVYALEGGSGIEIIANVGSDSGVTIVDMGGASFLVTDKPGKFTFGSESGTTFETGSDSYIGFMTNGAASVVEIMNVSESGWVESDSLNKMSINDVSFDIQNDEGTMRVYGKGTDIGDDWGLDELWGDEWGNGITKITKVGNASGSAVIVNSAGSAATIETDQNGEFQFASGQNFTLDSTADAVSEFLMDGSHSASVTGIEGFEDGTIAFNTVTTALSVNTLEYAAQNMSFGTTSSVTLTVDPYQVVAVDGITAGGYVSGVVGNGQDATVWAEGPVTINGEFIDITDSDKDYGIIVRSGDSSTLGTPEEAIKVTGDATVNVASFSVAADGDGEFLIGGESFEFTDAEDEFKFTTDADKKLESVDSLNGTLVDYDGAVDLDGFNGDGPIVISGNSSPATLTGNNEHLTRIDTLDSGAVITGDVSNADIIMVGDSEVGNSIPSELTVNGNTYQLFDDTNGITIRGAGADGIGTILGLDEATSLKVSTGGVYTVNDKPTVFSGQGDSPSVKAGDIIIGIEDTQSAYIYDASNPLIREKTPLDEIERITGIPSDGYDQIGGQSTTTAHPTTGIPLNIAETNIIQGSMSAGEAATVYPYVTSRYNSSLDVDLDQPLEIWIDNKESPVNNNQDLNLSDNRYAKKVHMFKGTQSVEFNNDGGNLAHIESVASGHKTVDLGDGGDVVVMDEKSAVGNSVSIIGGLKNDSIFVRDSANTTVDVSAGGADKIITYANAGARVTVVGYEPSMEGGIRIDELQASDMLTAIRGQSSGLNINFGDGVVSIEHTNYTNHSEVSLGADANNATFINLFNHKNEVWAVGFTGTEGGTLDVGSTENDPLILVGNYKGEKTDGSVILGGAGPDTVLAGAMDSVDARGGNNRVILEDNAERGGAVIAFTQGRATVENMNNTLAASTGDTIVLSANNIKNFLFDGEDVTIDGNGFYGILENVDAEESSEGKYVTQYIYNSDNSTVYKAAGAVENGTIYLPKDEDLRPNAFFGKNSGIDFGDYADPQTVMIDLKGDMAESSIGGSPIYTRGITGLYGYYYDYYYNPVATKEDLIFKGSDANDTLIAGNGNTSLYGDGGKNWLEGSYDYDETLSDKEGRVTFFVIGNANGAANTISNFEYVSDNNYKDTSRVTADQIEILEEQSEVVYADVSNNDVYIEVASFGGENKETVVLKDAIDTVTGYGKDFIVSGNVAQVGKDKVLVDRFGEFYMATEKNATINVEEEGSPVTVWLDNPETGKTFRGDFAVIDASTLTSNAQLAGLGTKENTIIGGYGNNSLWGGEGSSNDVLIGGAGKNTFFYGLGNGQDTIEANDGDEVVLGISIDDIVESQSSIGDTSLTLKLRDGGSLTVNDDGGIVDYKLTNSEGVQETYYLDSNRQFKQR